MIAFDASDDGWPMTISVVCRRRRRYCCSCDLLRSIRADFSFGSALPFPFLRVPSLPCDFPVFVTGISELGRFVVISNDWLPRRVRDDRFLSQ